MTRQLATALVLALGLGGLGGVTACGDDGDGDTPAAGPAAPAAAAAAAKTLGGALVPQVHVEDRVPQNERGTIRHTFRERDFTSPQSGQNRDPFQSFVVVQPGLGPDTTQIKIETTPQCTEKQMVATSYSYTDLRLVGIITQGTERHVLMMDSGNLGHSIRRNDCVGKEKAFVKDIGDGYITFEVSSDNSAQGNRLEEHSVQLHNKQLQLNEPPTEDNTPRTATPIIAPTPLPPAGGGGTRAGNAPQQPPPTTNPPSTRPSGPPPNVPIVAPPGSPPASPPAPR